MVPTSKSVNELNPKERPATQVKATDYYSPVVVNKVVLTFQSVDEILKCDHSNESY